MALKKPSRITKRRKSKVLGDKTIDALLDAPENLRDKVIISLLINTGMRRSDIAEMKVRYIDTKEGAVLVPRQVKTGKTVYLTIPPSLKGDLKIYINDYLKKSDVWLFPSTKGKDPHIAVRTVSHVISEICKKAGIKDVTPHDFRATFLTYAGKQNIPMKMVVEALGIHEGTVRRYYQKFTLEDTREQFSKIQRG